MANLKRFLASIILITLTSCGLTTAKPVLPTINRQQQTNGGIQGTFAAVDGSTVDLGATSNTIQIVMFVSETCSVCRRETQDLVQDRSSRGIPTNAIFYSIVVGSIPQDAQDWKSSLGVNWIVGTDKGDSLFRKYCPEGQTPCALLTNPSTGSTTKVVGEHTPADFEQITGKWNF